jgi:hypothetical protein
VIERTAPAQPSATNVHLLPRFSDGYLVSKRGKEWVHSFEQTLKLPDSQPQDGHLQHGSQATLPRQEIVEHDRDAARVYLQRLAERPMPAFAEHSYSNDGRSDSTDAPSSHGDFMESFANLIKIHSSEHAVIFTAIDLSLRRPVILKACSQCWGQGVTLGCRAHTPACST